MARAPLTAESVVDGWAPQAVTLSPDGNWVAYVVAPLARAGDRPVSELWVAAVDGATAPRRLTSDEAYESAPRWAADSRTVHFLSDRAERGTAQLHRVGLVDGATRAVTAWAGGVSGHLPLAEPDLVVLIAADEPTAEDERRVRERDDARVRGERVRPDRLRLLDVGSGRVRTPDAFGDRHVVEVAQRPDDGLLAVLTWSAPEVDPGLVEPALHLLDPVSGVARDLGPAAAGASSLVWWAAADGWHLAYLATTPPALVGGDAVLDVTVPSRGPAGEHRNLTAGTTVCPSGLVQVDTGPPLVLVADGLDTAIHRLDPDGPRLAPVSRVEGLATSLTTSRDGDVVAAVLSTSYRPKDVHAGPTAGPLTRLSDLRPELRDVRWGVQQRLSYRAADGLPLDGLLILPAGRAPDDGPFPLVTLVHGGPYDRHADRLMLDWHPSGQWLATAGYAVFLPNPRGGRGHGHDFAVRVAGAVGLADWPDVCAGIDLLVADGVADPDRLGIGGWSHGGFLAAWAVGQTDRFRAAVTGAGISDWGMLAATGEQGRFEAALGGSHGWEGPGPHHHDRLSPISYAARVRTPVLILHGEEDTNVPVSQAEFFHRALRAFGVEHEYVVYPRENHAIRERSHQLDVLRRTRAWFDRWLG
ncbi:alpha/beta hydrolase family protein [Micromonospora auratinigra]|uniref:Dipeptidyl aminopeptidase/acylaminoacyl peptidase n=1 Tax=Micromonospora auratinigra TaxID=261654 RepID=A0A1A8ZI62_9ACTN|nr:S9 family peptidase [Micromonospora auratinigra]SBT43527.1 Dipeptidyl aminopeptidase/acylaminoacyl peptidase [Micromonospora auratinigra]